MDYKPCDSLVHTHTGGSCSNTTEVSTLVQMDHKPMRWCYCTTQTVSDNDSEGYDRHCRHLTAEAKIGLQWGYDVAMKGASVAVMHPHVNKCHINGGLSMVPCEVVNDHGRKLTSQGNWR
jgi:hypothetical protein